MLLYFVCFASFVLAQSPDSSDINQPWRPSPGGAVLRSILIPGWGQAYNGQPFKAAIYAGIEQTLIYNIYRANHESEYYYSRGENDFGESVKNDRNRLMWYLAGVLILSMTDAYVDAILYDFDISDEFEDRISSNGYRPLKLLGVEINFFWRFYD